VNLQSWLARMNLQPYALFTYQIAISTVASIITGRPSGKVCTPIAERACIPISEPYNDRIKSEKPLTTLVVWVNVVAAFTNPLT